MPYLRGDVADLNLLLAVGYFARQHFEKPLGDAMKKPGEDGLGALIASSVFVGVRAGG